MNSTKFSIAVAFGLALLAAGLATRQLLANRAATATLAMASQQNERRQAVLNELSRRAAAAEGDSAEIAKSLDAARVAKAVEDARVVKNDSAQGTARPAPAVAVSSALSTEAVAAGRDFIARHTEVKNAVLDLHRAQIAGQFGPLFKQLGFGPEQIEAFTDAMMHGAGVFRMVPDADGRLMVLSVPTWGDPQKRSEEEAQLGALLGSDGIRQLREFIQLLPARKLAAQLASAVYFTPTPLTAEQTEKFVRIVAEVRPVPGATNWNAILARAQGVLPEPQLAALMRFQAQEQYSTAMNQAIARNQQPGNKP